LQSLENKGEARAIPGKTLYPKELEVILLIPLALACPEDPANGFFR
jgi:hypothetical protein